MGRHPRDECTASDEHSQRVVTRRDQAISNLFAVAIKRRTAPKREDIGTSPRFTTSASGRTIVRPEKSEADGAASIRGSTEVGTVTPDCHSKQGKPPLGSRYRAAPSPDTDKRLQVTPSPSAQAPGLEKPNIEYTSAIRINDQPPADPFNDIFAVSKALICQLHIIQSSLNASKREYRKIKTYQHKALIVFCTGRCEGWVREESKIERRIGSVSRALREDRKWEREIVEKLEELESILREKGYKMNSWRQPTGLERWTPG